MDQQKKVRVRIAPSPTGDPHVGLAYITLFNYVFSKQNAGELVLRIEDTDRTRYRRSSEERIIRSLNWLNLKWDEGPDVGGKFGPYRQSERLDIYKKYAEDLISKGKAYRCFCTPERLSQMRQKQKDEGSRFGYDGKCRNLSSEKVNSLLAQKTPSVVRLKMPEDGVIPIRDHLRGVIEIDASQLDDQILIKSDGFPTYHLANVVDDHLMQITHVIRAEEWISSTPKHVVLYQAFSWPEPEFIHLPLLRNQDRSKISKRKNPTSLDFYRRKGVLPEAMLNFLALMGWSYGEDKEIFSLDQMLEKFSFKNVSLGGPIFDIQKLLWLNQQYIQDLSEDSFIKHIQKNLFNEGYLRNLYSLTKSRLNSFDQFVDKFSFFFSGELDYQGLSILPKNRSLTDFKKVIKNLLERLDNLDNWDEKNLKEIFQNQLQEIAWKPKEYYMPIRLMTTGTKDSPPLVETLAVLGSEIVRYRLQNSLTYLSKKA
ncbi:MAG: glutamate--tRNA ligase [Zetaproteobacteria bacterium]|nr:glutamate--tRNA ligase [Pseudobdellovibrionaceae bacterium]